MTLLEANGDFVSKKAITGRIWPEGVPSENNLFQQVYLLRNLLRDQYGSAIVGARQRGYRLALPISGAFSETQALRAAPSDQELAGTPKPDGITHYARGSCLVEKETSGALADAVRHFEATLSCEPDSVPALFGIARALDLLAEHAYIPSAAALAEAKRATKRALEIDASYAPARALLAKLKLASDWDWHGAARDLRNAIQLNPSSSFVHGIAMWAKFCEGDVEQALTHASAALRMSSTAPSQLLLGRALFLSRRYEKCVELLSALVDVEPGYRVAFLYRAQAYIAAGRPFEAMADLNHLSSERLEDLSYRLPLLARAYALCGEERRAAHLYTRLLDASRADYVSQTNLAMVAA
ncbi:MAG TPA: hypothetical protein VMF61_04230, partial [Candidatus Acidoferrales bacterium]|nr:hypothetical protein [Candidatus Acidoferrales bacterium]